MGPLQGVKVIELLGIGPGPFCATLLADMGAEVVRVERADLVDRVRRPQGFVVDARGRRSLGIDLKAPEGRDALLRMIEQSDALIEGFRPGVMERLGLGPDDCLARNERLVYGRMTGLGSGRAARALRRSRHQLHLGRRRAGALRPCRRPAHPAAQHDRRLRRRRHVPRLRCGVRAARGAPVGPGAGGRRRDGRRRRVPDAPDVGHAVDGRSCPTSGAPTCSTPARRSTTRTRPPTASGSRSARWSRSSTPSCWSASGSRPTSSATRTTGRTGRRCGRASPRSSSRRRATSGARGSRAATPASVPSSPWARRPSTRT